MKTTFVSTLALAAAFLALAAPASGKVTLKSLLEEMTDPDANTYLPSPRYTARLWSSYDRKTTEPGTEGWFANSDSSKFLREETVGERREQVMLDAKGPGVITRFWVTVARTDGKGILRIYIDGKLAVEGEVLKILSGGALCGAPLSDSVSRESPYLNRGHDLYLPIPYAESCKVTYESATLYSKQPRGGGKPPAREAFYYNVETRAYAAGTEVESFSLEVLRREKAAVDAANRKLDRRLNGADKAPGEILTFDGEIPPGQSVVRTVTREGGGAIRRLAMAVASGKDPNALRSTVLEISFDGERTVWVPAGEFFGCGYTYEPYSSWFTSCTGAGRMESRWTMPFEKTCTVTVRNYAAKPVALSLTALEIGGYRWDPARSMHFGACWHEYADAPSRRGAEKTQYDYDYAELEGEGLFVGTTLALWQPATRWWGEGDEKVFIDGENTPSYIGTGTEDYYGYAWCRPQPFDHPFIAQPIGIGQGRPLREDFARRNAVNVRNRALDAIPFTKSIRFHMEMWHWLEDIKLDFAPLACWYMRPGGKANRGADPAAVRRPVRVDMPPVQVALPKTAVLFADFENGTYEAWKAEGEAFGPGPARGILPFQNPVNGYSGRYLVNSYYGKDETKGTLTSPAFTIEKPFINFLVGGGNYKDETCVNLVIDGKTVRTATGKNAERLEWTHWDVGEFKGKKATIVIVDNRTGHFGHINADCFHFDIAPRK
ncbi:MAG: DUF2961 domain-containing protein [Kiritimatiellae bacterium]|nr:DUF2961 domain-containing protein [Kiritimatiellia bacterium]